MESKAPRLLRVPQVAERLAIRESTVRKMIFQRRLPTVRIGKTVTIPEEVINEMIRSGYRPALTTDERK